MKKACLVEKMYGRNIMSSFHGLWSLGGFSGGIIETLGSLGVKIDIFREIQLTGFLQLLHDALPLSFLHEPDSPLILLENLVIAACA